MWSYSSSLILSEMIWLTFLEWLSRAPASCSSERCCCCWGFAAGTVAPWWWMLAFWWERCPLPSSSSSCSSELLSHSRLGAAWSCRWHSLSLSFYSTCFLPTLEALRRKSDISCSFPWHRPWVCSTAEQWECMQRRHPPGAGRCVGGAGGGRAQEQHSTQRSCRGWKYRNRSSCICQSSEGSGWRADGAIPVWSLICWREALGSPIPACPEWWDQLLRSVFPPPLSLWGLPWQLQI